MNKKLVIAAMAVVGVALAGAIPALAQDDTTPTTTEEAATCPYHDQTQMNLRDMDRWMDSAEHDEWMDSTGHERMHAAVGDWNDMMGETGMGPGHMMGGMMGAGNMMGGASG